MNTELQSKIVEDLEKSGFGSEMRAAKIFISSGWRVSNSISFMDLDHNRSRELDIRAEFHAANFSGGAYSVYVALELLVEVKKATKPWVVFKVNDQHSNQVVFPYWRPLLFEENMPHGHSAAHFKFLSNELRGRLRWKGYGIHESFKSPRARSRWYSAFVVACKAASAAYEIGLSEYALDEHQPTFNPEAPSIITWYLPVIVLDGQLVSAELDDAGNMLVNEIAAAPIGFEFGSPAYKRRSYGVDVVTLQGLDDYLATWKLKVDNYYQQILELRGKSTGSSE